MPTIYACLCDTTLPGWPRIFYTESHPPPLAMGLRSLGFWLLATAVPLVYSIPGAPPAAESDVHFQPEDIVTRDVCILGGGSTGTYAAIRLRDKGHDVVVVEPKDRLGGHAETEYFADGQYMNYGVEGFFNDQVTRDYLARLDVDYKPLLPATLANDYVNFKTGERVPPSFNILSTVLAATLYRVSIAKFDYLKDGLYNLPEPVPDELLQPFGESLLKLICCMKVYWGWRFCLRPARETC